MNHDDSLHGERDGRLECRHARSEVLDADLDELQGLGDGPLAAHLRACAACRERAARILAAGEALDRALAERAAAGLPMEDMLRRVRADVRAEQRSTGDIGRTADSGARSEPRLRSSRVRPERWIGAAGRWRGVAALAAAAALAAILLWPDEPRTGRPGPHATPSAVGARAPAPPPTEVSVDAGRRFALMKTDVPTISVVWFY